MFAGAAVFVGSAETIMSVSSSVLEAFRRLLMQIGGANIAGADRAVEAAYFVVTRRRKRVGSFLLSTAARDPALGWRFDG
jgi:uncharacterized protein (UPF0210 family)